MTLFLDDIGQKIVSESYTVYDVRNFQNIPRILTVTENHEENIFGKFLLERLVYDDERVRRIETLFTKIVQPDIIQEFLSNRGTYLQILPMNSAEYCSIRKGMKKIPPFNLRNNQNQLPTWYAEIQRKVEGDHVTAVMGNTLKDWGDVNFVIIADTCAASGSTLDIACDYILQKWGKTLKHIVIISACGSWQALSRVAKICKSANIEMTGILGQVIFETVETKGVLGLTWTDLPILKPEKEGNPGSVTTKEFYELAKKYNQGKLICAVGDVGASIKQQLFYLTECMQELTLLNMDLNAPEWKQILYEYNELEKMEIPIPQEVHNYFAKYI